MVSYRLTYKKDDRVRFISHLDSIKALQRALRRTKLPLVLKGKFNKKLKISFAHPLPLGWTSETELVDIYLINELPGEEIKIRLNNTLPAGLEITSVKKLNESDLPLSKIEFGLYKIRTPKFTLFMINSNNNKSVKLSLNFICSYLKDFNIIDICRKKFYAEVKNELVEIQ